MPLLFKSATENNFGENNVRAHISLDGLYLPVAQAIVYVIMMSMVILDVS